MTQDDGLQRFLLVAASHRLLTGDQEKALGRRAQKGDIAARDELVLSNIRLVISIARYYRNRGLPMEDVVQHGILGLNRAAEKFDPTKDIRFSTYATLWIKQAIQRGISAGGTAIRLPSAVAANRAKVRTARANNPDADPEFLADLLDLDVAEVNRALDAAEVVTSLDREMQSEDFRHTILDALPDHDAADPHALVQDDHSEELRHALKRLTREQRRVIELCFGLTGKTPMTVTEVTKVMTRNGKPYAANTVKKLRAEALQVLGDALGHR